MNDLLEPDHCTRLVVRISDIVLIGAFLNNLKTHGRWSFAEFTEVYQIEADFKAKVESRFNKMLAAIAGKID